MHAASTQGRPAPSRAARALVLIAALGCLALVGYGLLAPFTYGHYGFHAGEYSTRARHTLRNGSFLPGNVPGFAPPTPGSYYIHHPVLTHQLVTATFLLFGDHEWSVRLAGIFGFLASFALLVWLLLRAGGPWPAAVGALAFAAAPIHGWYGAHIDPGFPALACLLGAFIAYASWLEGGRWRAGAAALLLVALSEGFEWSPYLVAAFVGVHVLFAALRRRGRYLAFLPLYVLAVVVPAALHVLAVKRAGQWADFVSAFHTRNASYGYGPFVTVMLEYGKTLLGMPLLLVVGASLLAHLARLVTGRSRSRDLAFLALLSGTLLYLHIFKLAVVTHAYRLLFSGVISALALADVAQTLAEASDGVRPALAAVPRVLAAGLVAVVLALTVPTTFAGLVESRAHGGIPGWRSFDPQVGRTLIARLLRDGSKPGDRIYLHPSLMFRMDIGFDLDRDLEEHASLASVAALPVARQRTAVVAFVLDALGSDERRIVGRWATQHPFHQYGPFGVIDLRTAGARLEDDKMVPVLPGPPDHRPWWRRYLWGPYAMPTLARDDAGTVALATEFGLPGPALGAHPPELTWSPGASVPALLEFRNYYHLRADARAERAEARLRELFAARGDVVVGARFVAPEQLELLWRAKIDDGVPRVFFRAAAGDAYVASATPLPLAAVRADLWYREVLPWPRLPGAPSRALEILLQDPRAAAPAASARGVRLERPSPPSPPARPAPVSTTAPRAVAKVVHPTPKRR